MRRMLGLVVAIVVFTALPASAAPGGAFPDEIPVPNGWFPEGIAAGRGATGYVGSLSTGGIYEIDLRSGTGDVLVPGGEGRMTVGLDVDVRRNRIFAAGGGSGQGYVFDAATGSELATLDLGGPGSFVNDVIVTSHAAYFTNSFSPELYRVEIGSKGELGAVTVLPLTGDFVHLPGQFNANGIEATPDGSTLITVSSAIGELYTVDPNTGEAVRIDLGGATVNGDGLLLQGRTLYAVQGSTNEVVVVDLAPDLRSGRVTGTITDDGFDVPTTVAGFGNSLYVVSARFTTPPTPDTEYQVDRVTR